VAQALSLSRGGFIQSSRQDGRHPILDFIHYYLYCRDAAALSNLKANIDEILIWAGEAEKGLDPASTEGRIFWLITGLIESGEIESAKSLVRNFRSEDKYLFLAIHLGAYITAKIRPASREEKKAANAIVDFLNDQVAPVGAELVKEFDSMLLEMRDGRPQAIDHEAEAEEQEQSS